MRRLFADVQQELGLSDEQFGKLKLFNRLLISHNDFKQAHEIASILLERDLHRDFPRKNRQLVIALNMAAVVAYARPFLNSRGTLARNRLPRRILSGLAPEELEIHETALTDRKTMMAHSDSDANQAIPLVRECDGKRIVIPKNASPFEKVLLPEAMVILRDLAFKLGERCFEWRMEMEPEMVTFLPRAQADPDQ